MFETLFTILLFAVTVAVVTIVVGALFHITLEMLIRWEDFKVAYQKRKSR